MHLAFLTFKDNELKNLRYFDNLHSGAITGIAVLGSKIFTCSEAESTVNSITVPYEAVNKQSSSVMHNLTTS